MNIIGYWILCGLLKFGVWVVLFVWFCLMIFWWFFVVIC